MPKSKVLVLAGVVGVPFLIEWTEMCPRLGRLVLCSMEIDVGTPDEDWSLVTDALVMHPERPKLELGGIWSDIARLASCENGGGESKLRVTIARPSRSMHHRIFSCPSLGQHLVPSSNQSK